MPANHFNECDRIRMYNIEFMKYSTLWPEEYQEIFKCIKTIGRERCENFTSNERRDELTVIKTKRRVRKVTRKAGETYERRANEQTMRLNNEPYIFNRFQSEIICHTCRKQLWASEYATIPKLPNRPPQAELLRPQRDDATVCNCSTTERHRDDMNELHGTKSLFSDCCSKWLEHDPLDEKDGYPIPHREPDRVFGLNVTDTIRYYMQSRPDLKHSPYPTTANLVYPFLISEAKAGTQNPGFESIDTQTAFPIRSCLMLQERLKRSTNANVDFNPLVWYIPYQGDIWKVAGCVIENGGVRVYNLWMGSTMDPDGALQLLHIVDYIVQWARDSFRPDVIACLARGWDAVQRQTISPMRDRPPRDIESSQRNGMLPPIPDEQESIEQNIGTAIDEMIIDATSVESIGMDIEVGHTNGYLAAGEIRSGLGSGDDCCAVVRQVSDVNFEFVHIELPETPEILLQLLRSVYSETYANDTRSSLATYLHSIFTWAKGSMPLHLNQISRLKHEWLRIEAHTEFLEPSECQSPRHLLRLEFVFDPNSWHAIRRLSCISCSQAAAEALRQVGQCDPRAWPHSTSENTVIFEQTRKALNDIRALPSELSTQAAIQGQPLMLLTNHDVPGTSNWISNAPVLKCSFEPVTEGFVDDLANIEHLIHRAARRMELLEKPAKTSMTQLIPWDRPKLGQAVLLQKPDEWPESTARWCLLLLKEPRTSLEAVLEWCAIYKVRSDVEIEGIERYELDVDDKRILREWKRSLAHGGTIGVQNR